MTSSPSRQERTKSVHTLLAPSERPARSQWPKGRCRRCGRYFRRARQGQGFCSGGTCRLAWWRKHRGEQPHKCPRCGERCKRKGGRHG